MSTILKRLACAAVLVRTRIVQAIKSLVSYQKTVELLGFSFFWTELYVWEMNFYYRQANKIGFAEIVLSIFIFLVLYKFTVREAR